jgi:hypothetical protein
VPSIEIPQEALPRTQPAETPRPRPQRRDTLNNILRALRSWETLQEEFRRTVTISGHKRIGFHLHDIEGDFAAFRDQNYFGQGGQRVTDNTELTVRVNKFLGFLSFDWRWSNSRFRNPYDARITYTYESPNLTLEVGDITASLGGANPLVGFNRTLKGASATATWGRNRFRYITSETKAAARTITISGNDSPGPYYLQGSQIVDGSERVQVDGVEKRRGDDYTIDYFGGILRFRDGMIIPRTSTIVVTYETYAFNSAPSRLQGFRLESNLGGGFNFGFTMLSQKSTVRAPRCVVARNSSSASARLPHPMTCSSRPCVMRATPSSSPSAACPKWRASITTSTSGCPTDSTSRALCPRRRLFRWNTRRVPTPVPRLVATAR